MCIEYRTKAKIEITHNWTRTFSKNLFYEKYLKIFHDQIIYFLEIYVRHKSYYNVESKDSYSAFLKDTINSDLDIQKIYLQIQNYVRRYHFIQESSYEHIEIIKQSLGIYLKIYNLENSTSDFQAKSKNVSKIPELYWKTEYQQSPILHKFSSNK